MPKQRKKSKGGRPNVLGPGARYLTVKLRDDQFRGLNRYACPGGRPGGRPQFIRDALDEALKLARRRAAR